MLNRFISDFDNEDGLSIKSGMSIGSDDDDGASEAYQEIKEVLLTNQMTKPSLKMKDVNFYEWSATNEKQNNNLPQSTGLVNTNKNKRQVFPDLKHTYFKPISVTQMSNTSNEKKKSLKYQHFNNWKLHLLNYKQLKGLAKKTDQCTAKIVINKKAETPVIATTTTTTCSNRGIEQQTIAYPLPNNNNLFNKNEDSFVDSFDSISAFNMVSLASFIEKENCEPVIKAAPTPLTETNVFHLKPVIHNPIETKKQFGIKILKFFKNFNLKKKNFFLKVLKKNEI